MKIMNILEFYTATIKSLKYTIPYENQENHEFLFQIILENQENHENLKIILKFK